MKLTFEIKDIHYQDDFMLNTIYTNSDNIHFHKGEIVLIKKVENTKEFWKTLPDDSYLMIDADGITHTENLLVQAIKSGKYIILSPTSSYTTFQTKVYTLKEALEIKLRGKIIASFRTFDESFDHSHGYVDVPPKQITTENE